MDKIAIVDDEKDIREGISTYLRENHFDTFLFSNGNDLLKSIDNHDYSLILLDVMMPEKDGLEICRELRTRSNIPVIFLSAAGAAFDRIIGLQVGADDYISKPFDHREVLIRIKTVLRRNSSSNEVFSAVETKDWIISPNKRTITYNKTKKTVKLTPAVFELFQYLYQNKGQTVSREKTFESLLNRPFEEFDRTIDIRISRLRKMLDVDQNTKKSYIETIKGSGYLFDINHEY